MKVLVARKLALVILGISRGDVLIRRLTDSGRRRRYNRLYLEKTS